MNMNTIKLNNGVEMPQMGYGVYQVSPAECERCVADALSAGYRMIDTAQAYHNEEGVGNAVRKAASTARKFSLCRKSGFPTTATKRQRFPSTRACVSCKRTTSI